MALTTYTELKSSIADWLNRSDLTTVIPDFISLAEAQIERTLRTRQMIIRANASFDAQYGAVPADFLEVKAFKLTSTNPITPLSFMTMDALDEESTKFTASGRPKFFGVVGTQFRFVPTPDASYTAEIEGTGLGLNISHNIIVQKHHGQITVDSRPGRTCFQIKLPVNQEEGESSNQ